MPNRIRQTVLCICALAYVLGAMCGSVEAVICYGADGHVAIEVAHDSCCVHRQEHIGAQAVKIWNAHPDSSTGNRCPCCIDVPISSDKTGKYIVTPDRDLCSLMPANHQPAITSPDALCTVQPTIVSLSHHLTNSLLESIILLI